MVSILKDHLARRPAMEPRDVYKLFYQGIRGPEHIISSPQAFTERLAEEWEALEPAEDDPLWETIRADSSLLRVNLRPFKAEGGSLEVLASACLETGQRAWGTQADLIHAWQDFNDACREYLWPGMSVAGVETFSAWLQTHDFPAVHHSERYRQLYRPAYRLVATEAWQAINRPEK